MVSVGSVSRKPANRAVNDKVQVFVQAAVYMLIHSPGVIHVLGEFFLKSPALLALVTPRWLGIDIESKLEFVLWCRSCEE
jgi:hypothetical protein